MAGKQSVINIAWNLDTTNFTKAQSMTDELKNRFESMRSPITGVNDAFSSMNDKLNIIKNAYQGISGKAREVTENNKSITTSINAINSSNDKVLNGYERISKTLSDLKNGYDGVTEDSERFTSGTQRAIVANQQLRKSIEDLGNVKYPNLPTERPSAPLSANERKASSKSEENHGLRDTVIGGAVGGLVGGAFTGITSYVSNAVKGAYSIAKGAQQAQLAWHTMGVNSNKDVLALTSQVGELRSQANITGADTTATQKSLYNATNGNVQKTKELTNEMFAYGKASGISDQQISSASGALGRLFNSSKVRGTAFTKITKQMPAMRNAIIKASGESANKFMLDMNAGKVSGQQLEDLMVKSAKNSGKAWSQYGNTAQGALSSLQGSAQSIWIATVKGMASETNNGIIQLSNLVKKNIKPISQMLIGVGNAGAKIASTAIGFLVKNQKPLGSIAHSLIDIVGTIGKSVWNTFGGVITSIGKAFGIITGNVKSANNPIQTVANVLSDISKHKTAIQAITTAFVGMFAVKKALAFAGALKQVAAATGLIKTAESADTKGGLLNTILQNGTSIGRSQRSKLPVNKASNAFSIASDNVGSNLKSAKLGSSFKKLPKVGTFGVTKSIASSGEYAGKTGLFTKAITAGKSGLASVGTKIAGSKIGSVAGKFASKIPYLDVAMAGTQLIGMNKHNSGGKIGSAGGMLAGTAGGAALGTAILPGVGTAIGGAVGGIAGSSLGKKIGNLIQSHIPKNLFSNIGKQWHSLVNDVSHSSFGKSIGKTFNSIKSNASKAFKPVSKQWHSLTISLGKDWKPIGKMFSGIGNWIGKQFAPIGNWFKKIIPVYLNFLGKSFKKTFSALGTVVSTSFKIIGSVLSGAFKTIKGLFETFSGIFTGNWRKTWTGVKDIFSGVWNAISGTFKDIFGGITNSISNFFGKVGKFVVHPIQSIKNGLHFSSGSNSRYPNGVPKDTHAIINDGNGREIIHYPNGRMVSPNGANIHVMLPKGSRVYNASDTSRIMNHRNTAFDGNEIVHRFAGGTERLEKIGHNITSNIKVHVNGGNMKSAINQTKKQIQQIVNLIKHSYTSMNRSTSGQISKMTKQSSKIWQNSNRDTAKQFKTLEKQTGLTWKNVSKDTSSQQKYITSLSNKYSKNLTSGLVKGANELNKKLNDVWESITSDFKGIFAKLSPYAHSGMNGAINQLNGGISGINKSLSQFGGNSSVLQPIHYANGTGEVSKDHLAMVNDATHGFQTEAIVNKQGNVRYANGRNALTVVHKGESVLNGADTHTAIKNGYIPHYAKGKSSKSALRHLASVNAKQSKQAFNNSFTNNVKISGSTLQKEITEAGKGAAANSNSGYNWSHAMWSVIKNAMSSAGAAASGLLGAVEKYGTGKPYVWGATGPNSFDCSGLVQYALKHMGIDYPRTSGEQIAKSQHISRSEARPGDLIGNAEHIGVVADKGAHHYFSAFNPSSHPNILMTPVNGSYFPGTPQFGRVQGAQSKNKSKSSGVKGVSNAMFSLVKSQLGAKALANISKVFGDSVGASANPAGDGVERWRGDVKKVLGALHLSTSSDMVARVLRQINTESSGNPNAIGGTDGLSDGRAMGLMQVKPGTFSAYGKPSLGKWNNGFASIYAGVNYAKHRYGDSLSFLGQGHGYANGGRPPLNKPVLVGENGPEIAQFDSPVKIHSNHDSKGIISRFNNKNKRSFSPNITININGSSDRKTAKSSARIIKQEIMKALHELFTDAEIEEAFG